MRFISANIENHDGHKVLKIYPSYPMNEIINIELETTFSLSNFELNNILLGLIQKAEINRGKRGSLFLATSGLVSFLFVLLQQPKSE
jgi:hypothetical protein